MVPEFHPLFRNPHVQTIAAHLWPRPQSAQVMHRRYLQTEPGTQVLIETQHPAGEARGQIVLVHGLEGSGEAGYMQSLAAAALDAGFSAHRFHMRTCGGTEHLTGTLYHAGLTSDLLAALRDLGPAHLVGFSLGGNVVLKLAGELGDSGPGLLRSVIAVSAPLDLALCARRIAEWDNRLYERRFVRRMRARLCATGRYKAADFEGCRSVLDIDERITAPSFGFGTADRYYASQSALGFLDRIQVPALLIHAKDDTLAPFSICEAEAVKRNPNIHLIATDHGGHLGFLARGRNRFWLDEAILSWI